MGVPYAVVKNKARLGQLVHQKTATAVALVGVNKGDKAELGQLISAINDFHAGIGEAYNRPGGKKIGYKSAAKVAKKQRAILAEEKAKQSL
jgi:large subunit ribosomal protein L7Ae